MNSTQTTPGAKSFSVPLPSHEELPVRLQESPHWILWRGSLKAEGKIGKEPIDRHGTTADMRNDHMSFADASKAAHHLRKSKGPIIGLGYAFTPECGIVGVDLDSVVVKGEIAEHLEYLTANYPTWGEVSVSGKGVHLFYLGGFPRKREPLIDGKQYEIFGGAGFIAVTGNQFPGTTMGMGSFAPLLEWFAPHLEKKAKPAGANHDDTRQHEPSSNYGKKALERHCDEIRRTPKGQRHFAVRNRSCMLGSLVPHLLDTETAVSSIVQAAADAGGEDMVLAERTARSGLLIGSRTPYWPERPTKRPDVGFPKEEKATHSGGSSDWAPPAPFGRDTLPPEFPADVLPPWLERFCVAEAVATQTPADAPAMLALAAVAGGLAGKVRYRIRQGWTKNANLYIVVAMESGERKSAVFKAMFAPIFAAEKKAALAMQPLIARATAEQATKQARLKSIQAQAAKCKDAHEHEQLMVEIRGLAEEIDRLKIPVGPRFLVDDETPENLAKTICEQNGRLMQVAAEGTAFEIIGGRYSEKENFDVYLKAHDGDPLRIGRVSRGFIGHDNPTLTCGLAVQPNVLEGLGTSPTAAGRGFLARWLYSVPEPRVGSRFIRPEPVPWDVTEMYGRFITRLWEYRSGADDALEIPFDSEADDALADFERRIEPRLKPDGDLARLDSWGGKLPGEVARLAGTIHMATIVELGPLIDPGKVPVAAVLAAVRFADRYLIPHAVRAIGMMHADPVESLAQRTLGWLARRPELKSTNHREVFQGLKGGSNGPQSEDLDPVFEMLVDSGHLRPIPIPPSTGPGRKPGHRYEINPSWDRSSAK